MADRFDTARTEAFSDGVFAIAITLTLLVLELSVPEVSFDDLFRGILVLLMAVSFLPFPTKLMAEAIESASAERVAVIFYGATLLVISVIVTSLGRYARGTQRAPRRRRSPRRSSRPGSLGCSRTWRSTARCS